MTESAFGIDHGYVSKAIIPLGSSKMARLEGTQIRVGQKTRGMQENARARVPGAGKRVEALQQGGARADALVGRARHRKNYPGSKKLNGFPRGPLP